jgi:hypothetical protein
MKRAILLGVALATLFGGFFPAFAQAEPVWVRGFPQRLTPRCDWYVALWSDGSYSATPWGCEPGISVVERVVRDGATVELSRSTGGYSQIAANGCTEYVTTWSDGSLSWLPVSCPPGVSYPKSQAGNLDPSIERVEVGAAAPPALEPGQLFRAADLRFDPQCGFTLVKIAVVDSNGQPLNGIRAMLDWNERQGPPILTNPSGATGYEPGWTDASLSGRGMVIGIWRAWLVDAAGARISDVVGFETNNDCETGNAKQIVTITFRAVR